MDFEFKEETYRIIGAAMEVHKTLGPGFAEKVYQDALEVEFKMRNIPFRREERLHVSYKDVTLSTEFVPDFICFNSVVVELKSVKEIEDVFRAQTINYIKVANLRVGLLLNFGQNSLVQERYMV